MAGVIVGGWDAVDGGSVYNIPLGGSLVKMPFGECNDVECRAIIICFVTGNHGSLTTITMSVDTVQKLGIPNTH